MNLENNAGPDATNAEAQELNSFTNQTTTEAARPSSVKKPRKKGTGKTGRTNRTPAQLQALKQALINVVLNYGIPTTIRHIYYLAVTNGIGPKGDKFYQDAIRMLGEARRCGELAFGWIVDNTREVREPLTFTGIKQALKWLVDRYELSYWDQPEADRQVQIWAEADTVSHIMEEVTFEYAVPFFCARGASSITFIEEAARRIEKDGRPAFVYWFGDWDKCGVDIFRSCEADMRTWTPSTQVHIERIAVTQEQIEQYGLLTHDCNPKHLAKWYARTGQTEVCELDAMEADDLKALVEHVIVKHIDMAAFAAMKEREASEKESLRNFAARFGVS